MVTATDTDAAEPPDRRTWRPRARVVVALAFVATCLAHAWSLTLSFQLDDFTLLADPWSLFRLGAGEERAFALRFTIWGLWGLLDLLPTAPSPVAHRFVGLALHAGTAALLARALLTARIPAAGALAAALFFGLGVGAAQAFTWSSAWGDLVATFFAALAAERFLAARFGGRVRVRARSAAGALALLAALLAKESLLPLAAALPLFLSGCPEPRRGERALRREVLYVAAVLIVVLVVRLLYLGTLEPRYGTERPDLARWFGAPAAGLRLLGQALAPYNADPLVADLIRERAFGGGPLAGACRAFGAPAVGLGFLAATVLVGLAGSLRIRIALAWSAAIALVALPAGLVDTGAATNGLGRTMAAPMLFTAALVGASFAATRVVARVAIALAWAALLGPLWLAYVAIERTADRERVQLVRVASGAAPSFVTHWAGVPERRLLVEPPGHFAGVSQLGDLWARASSPPFERDPPAPAELVGDTDALLARLAEPIGATWVVLDGDALERSIGVTREPSLDARLALRFELAPTGRAPEPFVLAPGPPHALPTPQSPAGLVGYLYEYGEGGEAPRVAWLGADDTVLSTRLASAAGPRRYSVLAPHELALRLGGPIVALASDGIREARVTRLDAPPRVALDVPASLDLSHGAGAPTARLVLPDPAVGAAYVRVELTFPVGRDRLRFRGDAALTEGAEHTVRWSGLRLDPRAPPGPREDDLPWEAFRDRWVAPALAALGIDEGDVEWRVEVLWIDGIPAARSDVVHARFGARR